MSHAALTAKYRPQTFADVAGQDTLKIILSRAALEGKVAPAYLFSGTRGVGKTTLARVFAKALNCRNAPAPEPCNECDICRAITVGNAVDVVEIDGASNRGIDDVRRLKEVVGYAPMEGRYKVFIIDEAHMLSREAFNALLKTLEEPPAHVTFIMATTEAHKFPATIISRCQHYVFKGLAEAELVNHLEKVLTKEGVIFDTAAVRLIARRGAGSVRDSMSLLGQVLALGDGGLTVDIARNVLGLAGHEVFFTLLEGFQQGDCLRITQVLREMLDQGLDIGFFLRELVGLWRNLFLLKQSGNAGLAVVELPQDEAQALLEMSRGFSLSHIHASWQMSLEAQRRILTSLEPALALELLLLNLAMLPQLLSLEGLSALGRKLPAPKPGGNAPVSGASGAAGRPLAAGMPTGGPAMSGSPRATPGAARSPQPASATDGDAEEDEQPSPPGISNNNIEAASAEQASFGPVTQPPSALPLQSASAADVQASAARALPAISPEADNASAPAVSSESITAVESGCGAEELQEAPGRGGGPFAGCPEQMDDLPDAIVVGAALAEEDVDEEDFIDVSPHRGDSPRTSLADGTAHQSWDFFLTTLQDVGAPAWFLSLAQRVNGTWDNNGLTLMPSDAFTQQQFLEDTTRDELHKYLQQIYGAVPAITVGVPAVMRKDREVLKQEIFDSPIVQQFEATLGAKIFDFGQIR